MIKYLRSIKTYIQPYTQAKSMAHLTIDNIPLLRYLSFKKCFRDRSLFIYYGFFLDGYWIGTDIQC